MTKKGQRACAFVVMVVLALVWLLTAAGHRVYGYTSQNVGAHTAYKNGYFYVTLQDEGGQTTRCKISVSRTGAIKYDDYTTSGQGFDCSLSVETANNHNVRLDSTGFKTTKGSPTGRYTIGNVTLRYTQHANYQFSECTKNKPEPCDGRLDPNVQNPDGSCGDLSLATDRVVQDTERTTNLTFYIGNIGLITHEKVRYQGSEMTLVYRKPVYTVQFHDASGAVYERQDVVCGSSATAPAAPQKTGHNFAGWDKSFAVVTAPLDIYPRWTPWQHTVHYAAEKASGLPEDQTKTYGSVLTLSAKKPVRDGCTFTHWQDPFGTVYAAGGSYGRDQNGGSVTLTARWEARMELKGRLDGTDMDTLEDCGTADVYIGGKLASGSVADYSVVHPLGTTYEIRNIRPKSGYAYAGVAEGSLSGTTDGLICVRLTFTRTDYTIRYMANGGTGSMADQKAVSETDTVLAQNGFQRPGYTFLGWSMDPEAVTAEYTSGQTAGSLAKPKETAVLYAVWQKTDASFDTDTLIHDEKMFAGDGELTGGSGTGYDSGHTDSSYARVDDALNYGYFTKMHGDE